MSIGERIREAMESLGDKRPAEGARRTKIPYGTFHELLNDKYKKPSAGILQKIADAYGVTLEWLLGGEENGPKPGQEISAQAYSGASSVTAGARVTSTGVKSSVAPEGKPMTAADQVLDLLQKYDALRLALEKVDARELLGHTYALVTDDNPRKWDTADVRWLDQLRNQIMRTPRGAKVVPITVKEDARATAESLDLEDRQVQIRDGVDPAKPRGEQRRKPRLIRGNRGG